MDGIKESERRAEELRARNEEMSEEVSLEEKKRMIREAKAAYGSDWKKMVGGAVKGLGKLRVNAESLQNLHSLGMGGSEMRRMNDPAYLNKRK